METHKNSLIKFNKNLTLVKIFHTMIYCILKHSKTQKTAKKKNSFDFRRIIETSLESQESEFARAATT